MPVKPDKVQSRDFEVPTFEVVNEAAGGAGLLICDHASNKVPLELNDLGLGKEALRQHIAWDIGAGEVTRRLACLLGMQAVLSGVSRLVIDCNRVLDADTLIAESSDGVEIPRNKSLSQEERNQRINRYFWPYHNEIESRLRRIEKRWNFALIISIHSFTPVMKGFCRPWHVGLLWDRDPHIAVRVVEELRRDKAIVVGENQPYSGWDPPGYALQVHGEDNRRPTCVLEIRQDLIDSAEGVGRWAEVLAEALWPVIKEFGD